MSADPRIKPVAAIRTAPLFDIPRYMRNLEAIYEAMWRRQQAGLPPESFSLAP